MKIGFLCTPLSGHLNPMTALARRLQSRGNEVVFFGVPDTEQTIRAAGLDFLPVCEKEYPTGSIAKLYAPVAKLRGEEILKYHLRELSATYLKNLFDRMPERLSETGVGALVLETTPTFCQLIPISLNMPFIQVWNVLHFDFTGATPISLLSWPHETTTEAFSRNIEGLKKLGAYFEPILSVAKSYAEKKGLSIDWSDRSSITSKLAVITQTPREFDFPGIPWPSQFHYAGPFHDDEGREPVPFPWEKLNGRPLIYASLGTLVNGTERIYSTILTAIERLPETQVVLSIGKNVDLENLGPIPPNTIVVRTAPQIDLLKRAALCITHAGLNTALECLGQGVPMVAIPIGYEQPGVAARIAYHGVGEFIELEHLNVEELFERIQEVLSNRSYRQRANYFKKVIAETRGLDVAAEVIEQAFRKDQAANTGSGRAALSHT